MTSVNFIALFLVGLSFFGCSQKEPEPKIVYQEVKVPYQIPFENKCDKPTIYDIYSDLNLSAKSTFLKLNYVGMQDYIKCVDAQFLILNKDISGK